MNDPQQPVSIQEALNHIKDWIASGDKEKAKQGLKEILEFDQTNIEAKKMLSELEKTEIPSLKPIQPPLPKAQQPQPTPPAAMTPAPPAQTKTAPVSGAASARLAFFSNPIVQKIAIIATSAIVIIVGGYFLYAKLFATSEEMQSSETSAITPEVSKEIAPSTEISTETETETIPVSEPTEKVKRR